MSTGPPLTDEQAAQMLARLADHFGEPVMPVSRYCDALRTWSRCMLERHGYASRAGRAVAYVELQIRKSNLLARLIYGGEELRTRECPRHRGRWSGVGVCRHGCGETGWIPNDWPDAFPRCSLHPDRPAVGRTVSVQPDGEYAAVDECFECYEARWS